MLLLLELRRQLQLLLLEEELLLLEKLLLLLLLLVITRLGPAVAWQLRPDAHLGSAVESRSVNRQRLCA
jgi:hypothetical protein